MPVGPCLDERRPATVPAEPIQASRAVVHRIRVVAVHQEALQPVCAGAICCRIRDGGHGPDRRVFHVHVVLADEDHGQLPDRREVERLMERADVRGPVTEKATATCRSRGTVPTMQRRGDGEMGANDRVGTHHTTAHIGEVHRTAFACSTPLERPSNSPITPVIEVPRASVWAWPR